MRIAQNHRIDDEDSAPHGADLTHDESAFRRHGKAEMGLGIVGRLLTEQKV